MTRRLAIIVLLVITLGLAACAPSASGGTTTEAAGLPVSNVTPGAPDPAGQALPLASQLLVGTFRLEGTDQAVTAAQAQTLLPLWQAVQALSSSSDAAPQETEAVLEQIQASLTAEQRAAVAALNLTSADLRALFEAYGWTPALPAGGTPPAQRTPNANAAPGAGGFGPGGFGGDPGAFGGPPPDGGFGAPGTQGQLSAEQQATLEARRAAGGGRPNAGVNTGLVAELIKLLEARAKSS